MDLEQPQNAIKREIFFPRQLPFNILLSSSHDGECTTPPITSSGDAKCETLAMISSGNTERKTPSLSFLDGECKPPHSSYSSEADCNNTSVEVNASVSSDNRFVCSDCKKKFKHYASLYKHSIHVHKNTIKKDGPIKCMEHKCFFTCARISVLQEHLASVHRVNFNEEVRRFDSEKGNIVACFSY